MSPSKAASVLIALLLLAMPSLAQNPGTEVASPESLPVNASSTVEIATTTEATSGSNEAVPLVSAPVVKQKAWSREFTLWVVAANLATVADIESTKDAMKKHANAEETSFLYGPHPSRARMYGINAPVNVAMGFLAYWAKSKLCPGDDCWAWRIPTVSLTIGHAAAATANFVRYH